MNKTLSSFSPTFVIMQCIQNNNSLLSSPFSSTHPKPKSLFFSQKHTASFPTSNPTASPRTTLVARSAATTTIEDHEVYEQKTTRTMYEVLLVPESADHGEIKSAFRRQARRWHPDTCQSPAEKDHYSQQFVKAKEAYTVLSDPGLREEYDFTLRTGLVYHGLLGGESDTGLGGVAFRKGKNRGGGGGHWGFGDWELQLDGLRKRRDAMFSSSSSSSSSSPSTWGSRRAVNDRHL